MLPTQFYTFSEDTDTSSGPFDSFNLAAETIDGDDPFSMVFVVDNGTIEDVYIHVPEAPEGEKFEQIDSPYEGLDIEDVG